MCNIMMRMTNQDNSPAKALARFLSQKIDEPVNNVAKFKIWQAEIGDRLRLYFDPKDSALLYKFANMRASPNVERRGFGTALYGSPKDSNLRADNAKQAKDILRAIQKSLLDVGLPGKRSQPTDRDDNAQPIKIHNSPDINIYNQQTQSQNQSIDINQILESELTEIQFNDLKQILTNKGNPAKPKRLSDFFQSVGVESMAKILTSIMLP